MTPLEHEARTVFVAQLLDVLERVLSQRMTRAAAAAWAESVRGPYEARTAHGRAQVVIESILNLNETREGLPIVREQDLRGFVEYLTRAPNVRWSREELLAVNVSAEALGGRVRSEVLRAWVEGLGWCSAAIFASPATGRSFVLEGPTFDEGRMPFVTSFRTIDGDDLAASVVDLVEVLGLRGDEVTWWNPAIVVDALPRWVVWRQDDNGNRFATGTLVSRSGAAASRDAMEATGHKQTYWVDRGV